jgi:hypothetical protein
LRGSPFATGNPLFQSVIPVTISSARGIGRPQPTARKNLKYRSKATQHKITGIHSFLPPAIYQEFFVIARERIPRPWQSHFVIEREPFRDRGNPVFTPSFRVHARNLSFAFILHSVIPNGSERVRNRTPFIYAQALIQYRSKPDYFSIKAFIGNPLPQVNTSRAFVTSRTCRNHVDSISGNLRRE